MISKFSVKKPYTILVGVIMVLLLGIISFSESTTDLLPEMELPYVVAYTTYPGASAEKVETEVTRVIEGAVATTENLINMTSTSSDNLSLIILQFADDTNMDSAMINLSSKIDMVEGYLPDLAANPNLMAINPNMMPIMMSTVGYEGKDIQELSDFVNDFVVPELEKTAGVASVTASGLLEETVQILLNQEKIDEINNKILDSVDSELADKEQELRDGLKEVNDGLKELETAESDLESAKSDALNELSNSSVQLQQAATNLIAMESQITQIKAEQMAFQGIIDGNSKLEEAIAGANSLLTQIDGAITMLETLVSTTPPTSTDPSTSVATGDDTTVNPIEDPVVDPAPSIPAEITALVSAVEMLVPSDPVPTIVSVSDYLTYFNTKKVALPFVITELEAQKAALAPQVSEATSKLTSLSVELATAEAVKKAASDALTSAGMDTSDLSSLQSQIESGKITAGTEFAVGEMTIANTKSSLEEAKTQLEDGLEQLADAKEDALKAANISDFLSSSMISNILLAENFSMPAGYVASDSSSILVKVGDVFNNLDEINDLLILPLDIDGMDNVYLKDLGSVEIVDNSDEIYTKVNGSNAVMISFEKTSTASTAEVTKNIHKNFESLMSKYDGLDYATLMDQGVYIDMIVSSVLQNFSYGGILAVLILMLFLKDIKPTLVIGLSIPFSLMFTIVLMYFSDITLNIISLSGLALGVGMLVDNSVVVVENIYRMRSEGVGLKEASIKGAQQVTGAIIASTLTTVCVFLPIVFATGITKQLFVDMGLTIVYSLVASLIVALTLVPMLASTILKKVPTTKEGFFTKMVRLYEKTLNWSLAHRFIVLMMTGLLFAGSIFAATKMGMVLIPEMASTQITISASMLDEEATLDDTIEVMDVVLEKLENIDGVETAGVTIGSGGSALLSMVSSDNAATFYIIAEENVKFNEIEDELNAAISNQPIEATISSNNMDISALSGSGIVINVFSNDLDELHEAARLIGEQLENMPGIDEVNDGLDDPVQEMRIVVDKNKAMEVGLTVAQVFQSVNDEMQTETSSTTITIEDKDYPVLIVKDENTLVDVDNVLDITLEGTSNQESVDVNLNDIAKIEDGFGTQSISRDNSRRYMSISASIEEGYNISLVSRDVEKNLDQSVLPSSISVEFTGENETIVETMTTLLMMIALAVAFIYMIMVAQFQSLLLPFIVMFTIPLAYTGGLLGLFVTGQELSITAMLGFLVLSGVVVNNGIVFIDYANQLVAEKMECFEALILTGKTRLRPILMTALTTILAMTTMALGIGDGAEMMQGMAIVTIGGLTYATVLTLYIVPIIYSLFYKDKKLKEDSE